ncbi:Uu.00g047240.m01.CDS01 [Anthostomella pinea]|uniref:Uu.00g047240.m01.CDS01 n=1 Tax=Anthostomella pinea TaxID=933095 RepID=A0AAI8YEH4_9PEZI|nr:Uu.00g047240.m01.CDS01 [Anthostomella pinea]
MAQTNASLLPLIPRVFFLFLEPVLVTYGGLMQYATSHDILGLSASNGPLPTPTLLMPSLSASYLFSMMLYGLIILLASPPNKRLVQLHIGVLILADFTHWAGLFSTIARSDPRGWPAVLDTSAWSPETWTLAIYPIYTLAIKFATLAGVFGKIKG